MPSGSLFFRKESREKSEGESKTVSLAAQVSSRCGSVLGGFDIAMLFSGQASVHIRLSQT